LFDVYGLLQELLGVEDWVDRVVKIAFRNSSVIEKFETVIPVDNCDYSLEMIGFLGGSFGNDLHNRMLGNYATLSKMQEYTIKLMGKIPSWTLAFHYTSINRLRAWQQQ
jgi:hypothetical protein